MSDPRYRPRDYTLEPAGFGKARTLQWDTGKPAVRLRAAQLQHQLANEIRLLAVKQFGSVRAYSDIAGQSEDRLTKMLRGEAIMRLEDIAIAQIHLGWAGFTTDARGSDS